MGAVLSHVFPNGVERPIAYASRTLTQAEKGYTKLEKEAHRVKKFHQFLYGRRFTLVTEHKPLLTFLGPRKEYQHLLLHDSRDVLSYLLPKHTQMQMDFQSYHCRDIKPMLYVGTE